MSDLTQHERSALSLLRRAADKADDDVFALRSTRDVADYLGVTTRTARDILTDLCDQDFVNCYAGSPLLWSITVDGRKAVSQVSP